MRRSEVVLARFARPASPAMAWLVAVAPFALPALVLGWLAVDAIYTKLGHPGAALDDSFIHFQYARAIAEGHPFRYEAGEPRTMGGTSALWPLMLAPFYALGCKGLLILWPAWILSFVALGLLSREVYLLTAPLAGTQAAVGAGAMVFAFSPFTWCAGSGMEVVPFALAVVRAVRRSSEWTEGVTTPSLGGPASAARNRQLELVALAFVAPLLRPEGALASLVIALALALSPRPILPSSSRAFGVIALLGAVTPQILSWVVTGHLASNTAQVKLLPGNPYYVGPALTAVVCDNLRTFVHVLLNGEIWSAEFVPHGSMPIALAGLGCIVVCGSRRRVPFRAASVFLALAMAVPCAYVSFLWNRLRYLWPFAPFWLVGLACLARTIGDILGRVRARWRALTPIFSGVVVGLFAAKLQGTLEDLAGSASGIDRQQVALGRWAKESIPDGARIGVNDTGAIAYFGDHPTFDIVGLTNEGEGRYWVAGAASRFEHYETLAKSAPRRLPQYFVVYPEWMALNPILGARLHEATVTDSSILGGQTMVAYEADYSLLGSGERPWTAEDPSTYVDVVDVADLDSEAQHSYDLLGAPDGEEVVTRAVSPRGTLVADGGRRGREREAFRLNVERVGAARGIVRLEVSVTTRVRVLIDGTEADTFAVEQGAWQEATFLFSHRARPTVELVPDEGTLTTYHYWFTSVSAP